MFVAQKSFANLAPSFLPSCYASWILLLLVLNLTYLYSWLTPRNIFWSSAQNSWVLLPSYGCLVHIYPGWWHNWSFDTWHLLYIALSTQESLVSSFLWRCVDATSCSLWSIRHQSKSRLLHKAFPKKVPELYWLLLFLNTLAWISRRLA